MSSIAIIYPNLSFQPQVTTIEDFVSTFIRTNSLRVGVFFIYCLG